MPWVWRAANFALVPMVKRCGGGQIAMPLRNLTRANACHRGIYGKSFAQARTRRRQ
jgi:hypothetical protein